jgi:formaldehyde-activating enzyme involved in methanogenesis
MVVRRGPNRDDVIPIIPYESTPEKYIVTPVWFQQVSYYTLRVYFSIPLKDSTYLLDPTTYMISGPSGSVGVTSVTRIKHKKIEIETSGISISGYYTISIVNEIFGFNNVPILLHTDNATITKYIGVPAFPQLSLVDVIDSVTIDATYDKAMSLVGLDTIGNYTISSYPATSHWTGTAATPSADYFQLTTDRDMTFDPDLIDTTNYTVSPALGIGYVQIIDSRNMLFYVSESMLSGQVYELTVAASVTNIDGQSIDPVAAKPSFVGVAVWPEVMSATVVDSITVDILYNKDMDPVTSQTPANYSVTAGMITLTVFSAVLQGDDKTVRLTISPAFAILYTVEVSNVRDVAGNLVDPAHDTTTFTGVATYPEVDSAASIDYHTLRIVFDSEMDSTGLETPGNYTYTCPGGLSLTTNTASIIDDYTVELTVNEEMLTGVANYTVIANGALMNIYGVALNPAHKTATFNGIGVAPRVSSAVSSNYQTIRVTFNENMSDTGLTTKGNYTFTGDTVVTADSVTKISSLIVDVTITGEMKTGAANYTAQVNNVTDTIGNVIDPAHKTATFNGIGVAPQVSSAASTDYQTIRVTFNEPMSDTGLTTKENYTFSGDTVITSSLVTKVDSTHVDVTVTGEMKIGVSNYTIQVDNVQDSKGNVIDPAHKTAAFNGIGVAPQVSSASATDFETIRITFNEPMSDTGLTTKENYTFSGDTAITSDSVSKVDSTHVDVTVTGEMRTGVANYTAQVDNVQDSKGNVIDPAHKTATFNGVGVAPQMSSATADGVAKIDVVFNENMDSATTDIPGYYTVTGATTPNVTSATLQGDNVTVELVLDANMIVGDYNVAVTSDVKDTAGNGVDPAHNDADFAVTVIPPQVSSAGYVSLNTIYINFDKAMENNAALTNVANYDLEIPNQVWIQESPIVGTPPSAKEAFAMTFDSSRNLVFIQGGYASGVTGQSHKYDYATNTGSALTNHLQRFEHGMVYRSATDRIIWYDGNNGGGGLGTDTYSYNPGTDAWSILSPAHNPGPRMTYAMCYDANRDRVVLFGGCNNNNTVKYNTIYEYDGSDWTDKTPVGTKPTARSYMKMVYDSVRQKCVLFGGSIAAGISNETWEWDGTDWSLLAPTISPSARHTFALAYNSDREKVILYGGNSGSYINETWEFDYSENTWTQIYPPTNPGTLGCQGAIYDTNSDKVIMFGGYNGSYNNNFWQYS